MQEQTASVASTLRPEVLQGFEVPVLGAYTDLAFSAQTMRLAPQAHLTCALAAMALAVVRQEPDAVGVLRQYLEAYRLMTAPRAAVQEAHDQLADGQLLAFSIAYVG